MKKILFTACFLLLILLSGQSIPAQAQTQAQEFKNNLYFGLRLNPEVKRLQEFLIKRNFLAPKLNTGNFFSTTQAAVRKYQKLNSLPQTGFVGVLTRLALNSQIKQEASIQIRSTQKIAESAPESATTTKFQVMPQPNYLPEVLAAKIFNYINLERQKAGAGQLTWSSPVSMVAKLHSEDQTNDNKITTDSDALCTFPLIRHEGFTFGFTLGERLQNKSISFRKAGENILIMPISQNLIFKYLAGEKIEDCPDLPSPIVPKDASREEKTQILLKALAQREELARSTKKVKWVNKSWLSEDEIAKKATEGWMNSEGHRANILNPEFTESGIGVVIFNDYIIATQLFIRN